MQTMPRARTTAKSILLPYLNLTALTALRPRFLRLWRCPPTGPSVGGDWPGRRARTSSTSIPMTQPAAKFSLAAEWGPQNLILPTRFHFKASSAAPRSSKTVPRAGCVRFGPIGPPRQKKVPNPAPPLRGLLHRLPCSGLFLAAALTGLSAPKPRAHRCSNPLRHRL